jgi:serine/threonine protein kinase
LPIANTVEHPGAGQILPIDSHPAVQLMPDGRTPWRTRWKTWDATFGVDSNSVKLTQVISKGRQLTQTYASAPVPSFYDSSTTAYYHPSIPYNSVKTAGSGLKIDITGVSADRGSYRVHVYTPSVRHDRSTQRVGIAGLWVPFDERLPRPRPPWLARRAIGKEAVMADAVVAGRYRLVERLAVSDMSEIWTAHDLELGRPVVVKLLGRDADAERFEREAQAAAALSHPNICRLYDYGETDGRPFIVLEQLGGRSLEDRLAAGRPLPDADTGRIAQELASALGYAHAHGVVHRDVKPANVLFDEDGRAKIADFGIARISDASTLTEQGIVLGTAAYMSPEQASGAAVGPQTDVYSFGVILYRMLTGHLPFESESPLELAAMHVTHEPRPISSRRPGAPPDLERVATRALGKRPEDRPSDGNALLAELMRAGDEQTQVLPSARPRLRPRHVATGAALAALALLGAGVAVLATPESSNAPVTGTKRASTSSARTTGGDGTTPAASTDMTATTATASIEQTTAPPEPHTQPATAPSPTTTPTTAPATTETVPPTETTTTAPTTDTTTTVGTTTGPGPAVR